MSIRAATRLALCACLLAGAASRLPADGSASAENMLLAAQAAPREPRSPATPDASRLWMVPDRSATPPVPPASSIAGFSKGVKLFADARYAEAMPLVRAPALAGTPLAGYATFFTGMTHLQLNEAAQARETFAALRAQRPEGFLAEAGLLGEADAAVALGDHAAAVRLYAEALERNTATPEDVLLRLARSAKAAGDTRRAAEAYAKVYGEFPLSDLSATALAELEKMAEWPALAPGTARYRLELARADRLFAARRYPQARAAFEALWPHTGGDDTEMVELRLAQCDFGLRRYAAARTRLRPLLDSASRSAEARFFYLSAIRELGEHDTYERLARELISTFETNTWAEDTLNALASFYIVIDEDARADETFRELLSKFPKGRYAERAAWKIGWWAYKHGRYEETVRQFESAAAAYPRSDYRPAFLYWIARAHDRLGNRAAAEIAHETTVAAYGNSYYGRLAARRLGNWAARPAAELPPAIAAAAAAAKAPPTQELISLLLSLELYDQALDELLYAQRTWGNSSLIEATLGWVYNRKGDFRKGIVAMRRAYPQFLAAGGELLPVEIRRIIHPVDYWPLIQKHATARRIDPFLVSALIAQESSFDPAIRSQANAIGLMQILPSTGRRYARLLGIRRYSTAMLTRPEINIQIGTAYFADLLKRFGRVDFALAGYNAGDHRVAQWMDERPGLDQDEFIDDVPFPETQNYLKRILGPAEDYRRLYGDSSPGKPAAAPKTGASKTPAKPPVKKAAAAKK